MVASHVMELNSRLHFLYICVELWCLRMIDNFLDPSDIFALVIPTHLPFLTELVIFRKVEKRSHGRPHGTSWLFELVRTPTDDWRRTIPHKAMVLPVVLLAMDNNKMDLGNFRVVYMNRELEAFELLQGPLRPRNWVNMPQSQETRKWLTSLRILANR